MSLANRQGVELAGELQQDTLGWDEPPRWVAGSTMILGRGGRSWKGSAPETLANSLEKWGVQLSMMKFKDQTPGSERRGAHMPVAPGPSSWLWTWIHCHCRSEVAKTHHMQRKAIFIGSTPPELKHRIQSPNLLASRISSSCRQPVYTGPFWVSQSKLGPSKSASLNPLFQGQPLYTGHLCSVYAHCYVPYHELQQTCIKNLVCGKASRSLKPNYTFLILLFIWERGRKKIINVREKHQLVSSCTHSNQLGIKPTT